MDDCNENPTVSSTSNVDRGMQRVQLRELQNEIEEDKVSSLPMQEITKKLVTMNEIIFSEDNLNLDTNGTCELAMDSGLFLEIVKIGCNKARNLDTNLVTFIPSELTSRMKILMRSDEEYEDEDDDLTLENWVEFGKRVSKLFRRPPKYNFLLGAFPKFEEKVVKQRKPKDKVIVESQKTAPENISAMGTGNQEVTSEEVERVLSVLRSYCQQFESVLFFEFVTDPNSFSRTIENIFHVSFLIKNGFVKLYEDDDELLTLEVVQDKNTNSSSSSNPAKKNETLLSITQKDWKEIIKAYKIEKAILEPRSNSKKRGAD